MIAPGDRTIFTTDLVWDTPAADLLRVKDQKLREMGLSESAVQTMIGNPWHSLSLLTALVTALDQLQGVSGRDTVATLAASAISEDDARFVTAARIPRTTLKRSVRGCGSSMKPSRAPRARATRT